MTTEDQLTVKAATALREKTERLQTILRELKSVVVAFSGGVDSTYLVKAAVDVLGDRVLAVTGDSPSVPRAELENASELAVKIGAHHRIVPTSEMADKAYIINAPDRCFHCKKNLFGVLIDLAKKEKFEAVIEGSNLDDIGDYRPGMKAAEAFGVRSPLKEAGLTKEDIRRLSHEAGLPTWDKPAAPCLSSRIPYHSKVTVEKLGRIEAAEKFIRSLGFPVVRVRDHGETAKIEVPSAEIERIGATEMLANISDNLQELGYRIVSIDPKGYRSGALNEVLKTEGEN